MDKYEWLTILVLGLFLLPLGYLAYIAATCLRFYLRERRCPRQVIEDPVFGRLEYDDGEWAGVPAADDEYAVGVTAPSSGPSPTQRDFFRKLRESLPSYLAACKSFIAQQGSPPANGSAMAVYMVLVGTDNDCRCGNFTIELSDSEAHEIHGVEFSQGVPRNCYADD